MPLTDSKSVACVEAIILSLEDYLKARFNEPILYELFAVPFFELERESKIRFARIALTEATELVDLKVADSRPSMSEQTFVMGVSVVRAYLGNDASRGELWLMALKDAIVEWNKETDYAAITGSYIYTFSFERTEIIERNNKFVSRNLIFTAKRDLAKSQTQPE